MGKKLNIGLRNNLFFRHLFILPLFFIFLSTCGNTTEFSAEEKGLFCSTEFQEAFVEATVVPNFWAVLKDSETWEKSDPPPGILAEVGKQFRESVNENYMLLVEGNKIKKWQGDIYVSSDYEKLTKPIISSLNKKLSEFNGPQFYLAENTSEAANLKILPYQDSDLFGGIEGCLIGPCPPNYIYRIGLYNLVTGSEKNPLPSLFVFYKDATVFSSFYPLDPDEYFSRHVQGFIIADDNSEIKAAECSIYDGHSDEIKTALLEECLARALGLPGVIKNENYSLLGERTLLSKEAKLPSISENDHLILKFLYSSQIDNGMSLNEIQNTFSKSCVEKR